MVTQELHLTHPGRETAFVCAVNCYKSVENRNDEKRGKDENSGFPTRSLEPRCP